jgi:hypothetical protein
MSAPATLLPADGLTALQEVTGWAITQADNIVTVVLTARDGERFRLRLWCDGYPGTAPSVAFVDEEGSKAVPGSWPRGNVSFHEIVKLPPASFLCMPLTREGLAHHGDWKTNPKVNSWDGAKHTVFDVINAVQRLLRSSEYEGRVES